MKQDFVIGKVSVHDAGEIEEMIRKEFPYFSPSREEIKERISSNKFVTFKINKGVKLAGFIEIEKLDEGEVRINGLTIKKEFRHKHAAKRLLEYSIGFLREQGTERVRLLVKQSNKTAKALYSQFGFEFIGLYHKKLDNDVVEEMGLSLIEEMPRYAA